MVAPRYLLIAHEAKRSGAPILLLTFAAWLKAHDPTPFDFLLLEDGPLRAEFEALATTWVAPELTGQWSLVGRVRRSVQGIDPAGWRARALARVDLARYTTVYGNSIACLPWLAEIKAARPSARAVCAVHELTWVIGELYEPGFVARELPKLDRVVAGSQAVAHNLVERFGVPRGLIDVVHSFVMPARESPSSRKALRRELGLRATDIVVVAVAAAELRKGTDLAAPIAQAVARIAPAPDIRFVWLGGGANDSFVRMCRLDAERLGIADRLRFVAARPDADAFIEMSDIYALPSREDPFPLVVLTAVRMGKPVVAFERSGGLDEMLGDGAGRLVPYLDVAAFARAIVELAADPEARAAVAGRARARITARYDAADLARRLQRALDPGAAGAIP